VGGPDNQIYGLPANQFSPSAGTTLLNVPHQFSQDIGEWPENQILIPDWTYFYCPGATLAFRCRLKNGGGWRGAEEEAQETIPSPPTS